MKLDVCKLEINNLKLKPRDAEKIRGYLGNKYKENTLIHNHNEDKFIYRYPLIQYKIIDNIPIIIGINNGVDMVKKIGYDNESLVLEGELYRNIDVNVTEEEVEFGCTEDYEEYEFISPWIAINQKNIRLYRNSNKMEREEILKKVLIGNILSMSKGLGYTVKEKINCWINLEEKDVKLKGVKLIGFTGIFRVNFKMPDYLGLGKSVSKGLGIIRKTSY